MHFSFKKKVFSVLLLTVLSSFAAAQLVAPDPPPIVGDPWVIPPAGIYNIHLTMGADTMWTKRRLRTFSDHSAHFEWPGNHKWSLVLLTKNGDNTNCIQDGDLIVVIDNDTGGDGTNFVVARMTGQLEFDYSQTLGRSEQCKIIAVNVSNPNGCIAPGDDVLIVQAANGNNYLGYTFLYNPPVLRIDATGETH